MYGVELHGYELFHICTPSTPSNESKQNHRKGMRFHLRNRGVERVRMKIGKRMIAQEMDGEQRERPMDFFDFRYDFLFSFFTPLIIYEVCILIFVFCSTNLLLLFI